MTTSDYLTLHKSDFLEGDITGEVLIPTCITEAYKPSNVQIIVKKATLTLEPGETSHRVDLSNKDDLKKWGVLCLPSADQQYWSCADLRVARTISEVSFSSLQISAANGTTQITNVPVSVQIDLGGNSMNVASDGTLRVQDTQEPLLLPKSRPIPPQTTTKLTLTAVTLNTSKDADSNVEKYDLKVDKAANVKLQSLTILSSPSNLSIRLGQNDSVPIHSGPLITKTTVDVTTALNDYLIEGQAENRDGAIVIPIEVTLKSATPGRLSSYKLHIDYDIKVSALHYGLSELNLTYGYDGTPLESASSAANAPYALNVLIPKGATVKAARAKLQGEFDETRIARATPKIFDFTDNHYTPIPFRHLEAVAVSPTPSSEAVQTLAQPFQVEKNTQLTSIDLLVDSDIAPHSILNLALQADNDGIPSGDVLTSTVITVEKSLEEQPSWVSATLAKPFFLNGKKTDGTPCQRYWLVLQVQEGKGRWYAAKTSGTAWNLLSSQDNGFSWQPAEVDGKKLVAAFRLRHSPKQFQVPVQLQIGSGQPLKLSAFNPLAQVDFAYDFTAALGKALGDDKQDNHDVKLCFFSEAPGKLTLSEVDVDYQLKGE
jgi:hypothetical protein